MKKAFTLVEILVSITLLGIITIFVFSTITQTKSNNQVFKDIVEVDTKLEQIDEVLYYDILLSKEIKVKNYKKYDIVHMKSSNTIHGIDEPYVSWLVLRDEDTLIRLESAKFIELPIKEEHKKNIFLDEVSKNCESFSVNLSKENKSVLTFIKIKDKKPVVFETSKYN